MSAIKNVMKNNYRNLELNEFLSAALSDAGYGGVDVQKTPIGTRITLYVTRPGLVIGRKGSGIRDLTTKLEEKFGLSNPQNLGSRSSSSRTESKDNVQEDCTTN